MFHNNFITTFYLLQIRPIVHNKQKLDENLLDIDESELLLRSTNSLGHGIIELQDVVYVKTKDYSPANNPLIAEEIAKINELLVKSDTGYVLIGPGRWGSSDRWLGIPVKWSQISGARVIVEAGLTNYRIDPSQGTHFFQNLTSFGVGYFTVNSYMNDGVYDVDYLDSLPSVYETEHIRHIRFSSPLTVKMDGKKSVGVVLK